MDQKDQGFHYLEDGVSFTSGPAARMREIYLPLSSPDASGLKSAITPFLSGDIKIDRSQYVTKPVSRQDLRGPLRNFFIRTDEGEVFSLLDREGADSAAVEAGQLWHKLINRSHRLGLRMEALNFIPVSGETLELMRVVVHNESDRPLKVRAYGCVPIFGRPLANKHDHEHVTSLLHRTRQLLQGVVVSPTMVFNEEGHSEAQACYFVFGADAAGGLPEGSFPTVDAFLGDAGTWERPDVVMSGREPAMLSDGDINGKECAGAISFGAAVIPSGGTREYLLMIGTAPAEPEALEMYECFKTGEKVVRAFEECCLFWNRKSGSLAVQTADPEFDSWMRWVTLQPVLRRIFGCSFLPDHDYGKGGKGWRDIWQDLLSLILIEPQQVRAPLIENFNGVRVDGTNATIIGSRPGEFWADRNAITRVWMDHGSWPVLTLMLYVDQTGDADIIFEKAGYFRDSRLSRTTRQDLDWRPSHGSRLRTKAGDVYTGTVLEHMLVQTVTQFFNVGEHNLLRLESADWNDGLDMAFERGESAAFSSLYAFCLHEIADLLEELSDKNGLKAIEVFEELTLLLETQEKTPCDYGDIQQKQRLLFDTYCLAVESGLSGKTVTLDCSALVRDIRRKADWLFEQICSQERVSARHQGQEYHWFNGYYDNQGKKVEGEADRGVRMTLTGQVFTVMSGLADEQAVQDIVHSVNAFLKDARGGVRLNTDFGMRNYLDLGRAFSFAYGTKENGAVFSHMTVMYAYALYKRGFVREGFDVLNALYRMASDFPHSKIYPNLPEYFDSQGQGMYGYLTGSASWMVLTVLTQAFGVRGWRGDLVIQPKLVQEQFSRDGQAAVTVLFAERPVTVRYQNPQGLAEGRYTVQEITVNGNPIDFDRLPDGAVRLSRKIFETGDAPLEMYVCLGASAV